jgi:hypothetical protein
MEFTLDAEVIRDQLLNILLAARDTVSKFRPALCQVLTFRPNMDARQLPCYPTQYTFSPYIPMS